LSFIFDYHIIHVWLPFNYTDMSNVIYVLTPSQLMSYSTLGKFIFMVQFLEKKNGIYV